MALDLGGATYDDIEVQRVNADFTWDTDELQGGNSLGLGYVSEQVAEVAESLERDEIAELVGVEARASVVLLGPTETVDTAVETNVVLSTDADAGVATTGSQVEGVDINYGAELDIDYIEQVEMAAGGGFEDSASGVGGGSSPGMQAQETNFKEMFGRGPTYDRHDELWLHCGVTNFDAQDGTARVFTRWVLYWHIHDRDDL